jgi:biotin carboxylase
MERLLLLVTTTSYRAGAFLDAAARLGVPTTVGTDREQVLAAANPAGNLTLDFSAPERATAEIVEFARRHPFRAVIAADDDGVVLAAFAANALGLVHNPVAAVAACRDKHRMRRLLVHAGLPSPRFERFALDADPREVAGRVGYPCVLKPLFLAASRGVIRADDPDQLVAAWERVAALLGRPEVAASGGEQAGWILVEDYLSGAEVALEGLLTRGCLRVLALFDKPDPLEGPFFEETLYVTPSRLPEGTQQAVATATARASAALGLCEGPVHAELRVNEGGAWLIEIAPRSIGGLCSRALRFGDGMTLEELILRHALGRDVAGVERERQAAGVMMIPVPRSGTLRGTRGEDRARVVPAVEDVRLTIPPGHEVVAWPEGSRYLGFIFARDPSVERVEQALREAHRRLEFDIEPHYPEGVD